MFKEDRNFTDPIVRCVACGQLIQMDLIKKTGYCPKCGNKRVTNVRTLTENEMNRLREKGISENFLSEFEGVDDADLI